jgi:hypothetical protein
LASVSKGEKGNPMLASEFEQTSLISNLKEEIVGLRGAMGAIDNSMLFPIPFQVQTCFLASARPSAHVR